MTTQKKRPRKSHKEFEPPSYLDSCTRRFVKGLDATLKIATHDFDRARAIAEQIAPQDIEVYLPIIVTKLEDGSVSSPSQKRLLWGIIASIALEHLIGVGRSNIPLKDYRGIVSKYFR